MIKIINPGKCGIARCITCGCEFSYEFEDVILGNQMDPENFVGCPCCGRSIQVKLIPKRNKENKK